MMLVDTHCHLYLQDFDADLKDAIQRCAHEGVNAVLLPAIDTETHQRLFHLCELSTANCQLLPMMGLHPCSVGENFEDELNVVKRYLDSQKFYGVGEIGLDYYWDVTFKDKQIEVFERQLQWSIEKNLPVSIHSRSATLDCIESVKKFDGKVKGVFHCFGGTVDEAKEIIALGMYLGIGGVVTYKKTDLRETLKEVGLQNVVLETDAPYLPPVPYRGKRNEPSYIRIICEAIGQALGKTTEEVTEITSANAQSVFRVN